MPDDNKLTGADKEAAKQTFLGSVEESLKTATGKAKEGLEYIKENIDKIDFNKDGKGDLSQLWEGTKASGGNVYENFTAAAGNLKEKGLAFWTEVAPAVNEAAEGVGNFAGNNMWALIGGGALALIAGLFMGGGLLGIIGALIVGALAFMAISAMGADANGLFGGGMKPNAPGGQSHSQDQAAGQGQNRETGAPDQANAADPIIQHMQEERKKAAGSAQNLSAEAMSPPAPTAGEQRAAATATAAREESERAATVTRIEVVHKATDAAKKPEPSGDTAALKKFSAEQVVYLDKKGKSLDTPHGAALGMVLIPEVGGNSARIQAMALPDENGVFKKKDDGSMEWHDVLSSKPGERRLALTPEGAVNLADDKTRKTIKAFRDNLEKQETRERANALEKELEVDLRHSAKSLANPENRNITLMVSAVDRSGKIYKALYEAEVRNIDKNMLFDNTATLVISSARLKADGKLDNRELINDAAVVIKDVAVDENGNPIIDKLKNNPAFMSALKGLPVSTPEPATAVAATNKDKPKANPFGEKIEHALMTGKPLWEALGIKGGTEDPGQGDKTPGPPLAARPADKGKGNSPS